MSFPAIDGFRAWSDNKRRYGTENFSPGQKAIWRVINEEAEHGGRVLGQLTSQRAAIVVTEGDVDATDERLASLYDAFEKAAE